MTKLEQELIAAAREFAKAAEWTEKCVATRNACFAACPAASRFSDDGLFWRYREAVLVASEAQDRSAGLYRALGEAARALGPGR